MKKIILLLTFICSFESLNAQDATIIYKNTVNSTVTIETDIMIGSGFFVRENIIVTNYHVIEGASEAICYINNSPTKYKIEGYLSVDKSADLILLKVSGLNRPAIKFAENLVSPGQKVYTIGSPKGLPASISDGIVSGLRDFGGIKLIQITAPISHGSSGGPVLNENGELIGVSVGQLNDGQNLNFAIPTSNLENLLGTIKSTPLLITTLYTIKSSFTDPQDGQTYKTIKIGTQTWFAENLKTTKFNDGTSIPQIIRTDFTNSPVFGYCWYDNDKINNERYGALYNWYSVNTGKLCPKGWHVPSDYEWFKLALFLDPSAVYDTTKIRINMSHIVGYKLKATTDWNSQKSKANNESGFTALPSGYRIYNGAFINKGVYSFWWSATESPKSLGGHFASYHYLYVDDNILSRHFSEKLDAYSVRCVKDYFK